MEINFGASAPYTVGIEEELQLVDPQSHALVPAIDAVFAARDAAGLPADSVASELSASCVELRSPAYGTVAELAADFPVQRRRLRDLVEGCGARVAAAGAHPFSEATAQEITGKARYRKVAEEMGWPALMQAIYGLHVHVSVPDEEHAIRAVATLPRNVPLFVALSANSLFGAGSDPRLASVRTKVFGLMPRTGLPPAFRAWEDFEGYVEVLVAAGSIRDYSLCWWDARPHPRLGTVELRAPDAQTASTRTAFLAALVQCLVATADEHPPEDPLFTAENKWRATRYGLDARFHDFATGRNYTAREAAGDLIVRLRPISQDLGCEAELEGISEIAAGGYRAAEQSRLLPQSPSTKDVVAHRVAETA